MKKRDDPVERAARVYASLLTFYPQAHRRAFGAQMLQTFKDEYRDRSEQGGHVGTTFWLAVVADAATSIAKEQTVALRTRRTFSIVMLTLVALLLAGIVIFLLPGISVKLAAIIPVVLLFVVSLAVKQSSQMGRSSREPVTHVWMQQGLRCGVAFGVLWVVFNLASNLAPYDSALYNTSRMIAAILFTIGLPVAFGLTGFVSGRKGGTMKDGTFAGLLTSAISSTIAVVSLIAVMLLFWETVRANAFQDPGMIGDWQRSGTQTFDQFLWGDNLGGAFFMTLFSLIFGALLGTLGGALGSAPPKREKDAGIGIA